MKPRRPVRPAGMGQKNNDRIRVRNRRYKIKRFMLQPKNIDVKHNGRVVRRMVVRRQTIYPTTPCRREYETIYKHFNILCYQNKQSIQLLDAGKSIKPYKNISIFFVTKNSSLQPVRSLRPIRMITRAEGEILVYGGRRKKALKLDGGNDN